jgi:sterol desaturase/sphingolipid hydroxylase (fatty acid hydroxylase superfamily)
MFEFHEAARLWVFLSTFSLFALTEYFLPKRTARRLTQRRWVTNISLGIIDALMVRLLLPGITIAAAVLAENLKFGLFHWTIMPLWIVLPLSIMMFDWAIWLQHLITHKVHFLWRLHRVHHSDIDFDVTTGIRFHPLEILLSLIYKAAFILLLGLPAWIVFVCEVILNAMAVFSHANLRIIPGVERILRVLIVTPDMHRIHHSIQPHETDSNYGNFLSIWDRLFNTYRSEPLGGQQQMEIGLEYSQNEKPTQLPWSLLNPFLRQ